MSFKFSGLEDVLLKEDRGSFQLDSRKVENNSVFIALKGEKFDGHDFLSIAAEKGATRAIVDKGYIGESFGMELFKVENVLEAMQHLAKKSLEMKKGKVIVISVTGSVGKTTTKEFINTILQEKFVISRNLKSYNSQRGLPLSILNMEEKQDVILLEMGMSERGEMEKLANIVQPDIALFTPIGLVHAGNFEGVDEIVSEKSKVINGRRTKLAIVPYNLLKYRDKLKNINTISYAIKIENSDYSNSDYSNSDYLNSDYLDSDCLLETEGEYLYIKGKYEAVFSKPFNETHLLEDFLATYVLGREMGMTNEEIEKRLPFLKPAPMRFEKIMKDGVLFIKDCYNANSLSTKAALENLPFVKGKKIAVLGEMGELGKYSQISHEIVGKVAAQNIDILFCYGNESKYIAEAFKDCIKSEKNSGVNKKVLYFSNLGHLIGELKQIIEKDDLVLIKGSRYLELERVLSSL